MMEHHKVRISTAVLKQGMYVARLDRPWLETPFVFQGFRIEDDQDIQQLQKYCRHVYIDVQRGLQTEPSFLAPEVPVSSSIQRDLIPKERQVVHKKTRTTDQELVGAKALHTHLYAYTTGIMGKLRVGKGLDIREISEAVESMVESMLRNPDAWTWLNQLRKKDVYSYNRSLSTSVWAVLLGRHIGMPRDDLQKLALGALLLDVGKIRLPGSLLAKPGRLSIEAFEQMKQHVDYGVEILEENHETDTRVLSMVRTHHERYDGGGYPAGLRGDQSPIFGRIAALVDCYDAITSYRPYATRMSTHDAVKVVYEWRNIDFQAELVEQFIQAIGIYPTGTLVELSTGQIGIVIEQNRVRRLRPRVMLILDEDKEQYKNYTIVDLTKVTHRPGGEPLDIVRGLDPGAYGIKPAELFL